MILQKQTEGLLTALGSKADKATTYTKTEVDTHIADLVDSAPETLDTLNELATALGNDPNFATTVANQIGTKASQTDLTTHTNSKVNPHEVTKTQVGLGNVDNTADSDKSVASAAKLTTAKTINGVLFDGTKNITVADATKEPAFTKNTGFNKDYGTTAGTVCQGNDTRLSDARVPKTHSHTKSEVGLGNVDNTSDADKPVSTAQLTALNLKANLDGSANVGDIYKADTNGHLISSGKKFNDSGTSTDDIWSASKVTSAIAAGISGTAVTGHQVIKSGPTTPSVAGAVVTIADVFVAGKLPNTAIKPIVTVNGLMIPEGDPVTKSNRWTRDNNALKIKVNYVLDNQDEICVVYSY